MSTEVNNKKEFLLNKIKKFPLTSGVYLMKDGKGKVIYVGKAISLRKRVRSYFGKTKAEALKTDMLVADIADIDYVDTFSEAEALILEASLIKKYYPKYNIDLKDGKTYPFIRVTKDSFPIISLVRPSKKNNFLKDSDKKANHFGPYVNPKLVREALGIIRKIFGYRVCNHLPDKACLDYHIGLCDAPCIGNVSKRQYAKIVKNVIYILEGKKDQLYRNLRKDMEFFSREKQFEEAGKVRDQIRAVGALYSGTKDINAYKEMEQLQQALSLPKRPERVEAFDISNTMGTLAVGSMVSFLNGKPDKKNYRRFRIKSVDGIDDFKMMAEIVRRRYSRLKKEGVPYPDLIIVDGGKGQLSAAKKELLLLDVDIPLISLAKREEEVFSPNKRKAVVLSKSSLGLKFLQRIRDEAHRFAISYHRKLRDKNTFKGK